MTRPIPAACVKFIKDNEKCVLFVYDDAFYPPKRAKANDKIVGRLTAGYGHTDNIEVGVPVSQMLADAWLLADLTIAAIRLEMRITRVIIDLLTSYQYAALIAFVFNLGANPTWTIWARLKAKAFDQVPLEMMKFVNQTRKIKGKNVIVKVDGLVKRRAAEVQLWATEEPGTVVGLMSSSVTRETSTPPTPGDPTTPSRSGAVLAAAASTVAAAPVVVNQVSTAIEPYAANSAIIQRVLAGLAIVAASLTVLALVLAWLHRKAARS